MNWVAYPSVRPDELGGTGKVAPGPDHGVEGGEVGVPPLAPGERRLRLVRCRGGTVGVG